MNQTNSLDVLRRANPRHRPDFTEWADGLTHQAGAPPSLESAEATEGGARASKSPLRRCPVVGIPAVATVVAVVVTLIVVGSPVGPMVISPAAAMEQAVIASANGAESSGTVVLEITTNGELWAAKTISWNGTDLSVMTNDPTRVGRGDLLLVDGIMYGPDPEVADGWLELGPPESVDPDSGTTPGEFLTALREDVGGNTFRRITDEMIELTTIQTESGSTIYQGRVPAGALARESAVKEGEAIRVLPYGNVAHDDASNPAALIDVTITVGPDGTIGEIHATWGGGSSWSYRLLFSDLGSTAPVEKPTKVQPCPRCWLPEAGL